MLKYSGRAHPQETGAALCRSGERTETHPEPSQPFLDRTVRQFVDQQLQSLVIVSQKTDGTQTAKTLLFPAGF